MASRSRFASRGACPPTSLSFNFFMCVRNRLVVDLDGVETGRVKVEPLSDREIGRIEVAAPMSVLPAGAADPNGRGLNSLMG